MNCTPFVIQYIILSNKWGAVHTGGSSGFFFYFCLPPSIHRLRAMSWMNFFTTSS